MPRIPRNVSGKELAKLLSKEFNYTFERETGSHIRIVSTYKGIEHKITIPDHKEIKIGTLNNILKDICSYLGINKEELITKLFKV